MFTKIDAQNSNTGKLLHEKKEAKQTDCPKCSKVKETTRAVLDSMKKELANLKQENSKLKQEIAKGRVAAARQSLSQEDQKTWEWVSF